MSLAPETVLREHSNPSSSMICFLGGSCPKLVSQDTDQRDEGQRRNAETYRERESEKESAKDFRVVLAHLHKRIGIVCAFCRQNSVGVWDFSRLQNFGETFSAERERERRTERKRERERERGP